MACSTKPPLLRSPERVAKRWLARFSNRQHGAIAAPAGKVNALLNARWFLLSVFNSPRQTSSPATPLLLAAVAARARAHGLHSVNLAVSHAFHTPLVAAAAPVLAQQLGQENFAIAQRPVVSTVTGVATGSAMKICAAFSAGR